MIEIKRATQREPAPDERAAPFRHVAERRLLVFAALLVLTLVGLRFLDLRADPPTDLTWSASLYTDEGLWSRNAVWSTRNGDWRIEGDYNPATVMPIMSLWQRGAFAIFGANIVTARALSAACAALLILIAFGWLRRVENTRVATLAALLVAANALFFFNSRLVLLDLPMTMFGFAGILAATNREHQLGHARAALAGLLIGVAILTKMTAAVFLPVATLLTLYNPGPIWRRFGQSALLGTVAAAVVIGWFTWARQAYPMDFQVFQQLNLSPGEASGLLGFVRALRLAASAGMAIGPVLYPLAVAIGLIAILRPRATLQRPALCASLLLIGLSVVSFALKTYAPPRYFAGLVVPVSIVIAIGLDTMLCERRLRFAGIALSALVAVATLGQLERIGSVLQSPGHRYADFVEALDRRFERDGLERPILVGDGADTVALHTNALAITLTHGGPELGARLERYPPSYLFTYTDVPADAMAELERRFDIGPPTEYRVYDDYMKGRPLTVQRLTARDGAEGVLERGLDRSAGLTWDGE